MIPDLKENYFSIHNCEEGLSYMFISNYNPHEVIEKILKNQEIIKQLGFIKGMVCSGDNPDCELCKARPLLQKILEDNNE